MHPNQSRHKDPHVQILSLKKGRRFSVQIFRESYLPWLEKLKIYFIIF